MKTNWSRVGWVQGNQGAVIESRERQENLGDVVNHSCYQSRVYKVNVQIHFQPERTRAPWRKGDSGGGAGEIQDEPRNGDRKKCSRVMGTQQEHPFRRSELESTVNGLARGLAKYGRT